MNYLSTSRLSFLVCAILLSGGLVSCNGSEPKVAEKDTARHIVQLSDTIWVSVGDTTHPYGMQAFSEGRTKFEIEKSGPESRSYKLDGEVFLTVRDADKRPLIIHTRQLVITIQSPYARLHIDAFASSPGEQADLLAGQLKVTKSYHSATDNEPEFLKSGDMVMINKEIDLMEKETLDSAERKAVERKFLKVTGAAPHN